MGKPCHLSLSTIVFLLNSGSEARGRILLPLRAFYTVARAGQARVFDGL